MNITGIEDLPKTGTEIFQKIGTDVFRKLGCCELEEYFKRLIDIETKIQQYEENLSSQASKNRRRIIVEELENKSEDELKRETRALVAIAAEYSKIISLLKLRKKAIECLDTLLGNIACKCQHRTIGNSEI